jgi:ferredoxin-type protein NapF
LASRRDFLTAFKKPLEKVSNRKNENELFVRPPYSLGESFFQNGCKECESKACETSCEEKIIVIRSDGTPILNFTKSGCTFCEECAKVCEFGVLDLEKSQSEEFINAKFIIDPNSCVAHNGVICFSCKEPCIEDAILFNGLFNPVIDTDRCNGCGFCFGKCPSLSIEYEAIKSMERGEEDEFRE